MGLGHDGYSLSSIRTKSDIIGDFKSHFQIPKHFYHVCWSMELLPVGLPWTLCQEPCFLGEFWSYEAAGSVEWLDLT